MFRCAVIGGNQLHLPERLVREVAFKGRSWKESAQVAWYYREEDRKAVLAHIDVNRPSLEIMGVSAISGVGRESIDSGDVSSGRVTIMKKLPDSLYERLTSNALVLRPLYADVHESLERTCISVYPAGEYDRGELPNVDHDPVLTDGDDTSSNGNSKVGSSDNHTNVV